MFVTTYNHTDIVFSSDLHLSHDRPFIIGPRGIANIDLHDKTLEKRIDDKINPYSVLWLLGDTIFGGQAEERLYEFLEKRNCAEINLMPGNHFSGYKQMLKNRGRKFQIGNKTIRLVSNLEEIIVVGQPIVLSHYPILSWNGAGKGSWMVHGHVHGRIRSSLPDQYDGGKILDVGIESCPNPVSFNDIRDIMSKKQFKQIDHHGPDTQNPL